LKNKILSLIIGIGGLGTSNAQLPVTKLFFAETQLKSDSSWSIKSLKYLSAFNPNSYNNQPSFISESKFLASVVLPGRIDPDIIEFDLKDNSYKKIIAHNLSDYSPRVHTAYQDEITCVQLNTDKDSAQNLVAYDSKSGKFKRNILDKHGKIGYYRFWEGSKWICFLVDSINFLAICDEKSGSRKVFASDIGRCFELTRTGTVLYVHKQSKDKWTLKEYDIVKEKIRIVAEMPTGVEDFAIDSFGRIICARGSSFLYLNRRTGDWELLADISSSLNTHIKRISILGSRLLFVAED
jgi:hypothetical protein